MADEMDKVVAELDVYSCKTLLAEQTQIALFQYPLRPPWRPYDIPDSTKIRVKPSAKRIEMKVPLDTRGENYNEDVEGAMQLEELTLRSRPTHLATSYALGQVRNGKVFLMPIDEAAQLRPSMSYLDEPAAKEAAPEPEAAAEPELVALQVQVQRRETERQIQNKLNSHAYISKMEAEEKWIDMDMVGASASDGFWESMEDAPHPELSMSLSRKAYLAALLPAPAIEEDVLMLPTSPRAGPASLRAPTSPKSVPLLKAQPNGARGKAGPVSAPAVAETPQEPRIAVHLSPQERASLEGELNSLFRHGAVANLVQIRKWLLDAARKQPELDGVASCSDQELEGALSQLDFVQHTNSAFVHLPKENGTVSGFRKAVLKLFVTRPSIKKAEVIEAVKNAEVDMSEGQCMRAIKDICKSQGTSWHLKI